MRRDAAWLLAHDQDEVSPQRAARFEAAVRRRAAGEPLAYILGEWGFYGRTFAIAPAVLVPRPETEELLERALDFARAWSGPELRFCDVGTGSGVLALTLASELPRMTGVATEVSPEALAVAAHNASMLGVADRVDFVLSDLLASEVVRARAPFAFVVANLPYVPTEELAAAPDGTAYEPRLALDGGPDGLAAYRRLVAQVRPVLAARGGLFMEAGPSTAGPLGELAEVTFGSDAVIEVRTDYGGRDRIVAVTLK